MKKGLTKILLTMIFTLCAIFFLQVEDIFANSKTYTSNYASYTEQEVIETNDLGYNVIHNKIKAISTANTCSNPKEGYSLINSPQQVNMLTVPSTGNVRIVNYTFPNSSGWTKQTLSKLVQSFELTNPGWVVLAGVNGDFYDINGNDHALKYHTTGSAVSNGDVLRAVETKSIGYTNNGTANSFKMADNASFTKYHILTIYDDDNNIIKTFDVDKINSQPTGDELAVYYTYKVNNGTSADLVTISVPANNSYISENPIRCLPTSEPEIFAKGEISKTNAGMDLRFGQFAVVTSNEEIKSYLSIGTTIRVQKEVTGELADCDQVMGAGSTLVENGVVSQNNADGMRTQRHPRTCIGVKEDGTLMFFVIDGRQESAGYNGMTQDEMGTMMAYYGCYNGVNVDGGGSSTFGIRDEYGNFVIQNKPSDGNERTNSNALLVVVPQIQLQKSNITEDSITLSYNKPLGDIEVNNILVTINGITKQMDSNELVFDGLKPETEYEMSYSYDLTYNGSTSNIKGETYNFKTGKIGPKVEYAYFDINNNNVNLSFKTSDINELATFACIDYTDDIIFLENFGESKINVKLSNVEKFDFKIEIDYSAASVPNNNGKIIYNFTWYPLDVNFNELPENKVNEIYTIIEDTNNAIKYVEVKEDVISQILYSKENITKVINRDDRVEPAKEAGIKKLEGYLNSNNYSDENAEIIRQQIIATYKILQNVDTFEDVESVIKVAEEFIKSLKTLDQEKEDKQILEAYKKEKINELNSYVESKKYSKRNKELINSIINKTIKKINNADTKELVDETLNEALSDIDQVKTKSCSSNTIVIYSNLLSLMIVVFVLFKKTK